MPLLAQTYLESYKRLYSRTVELAEEIQNLSSSCYGLKAIRYDQDKVVSSHGSGMEDLIMKKHYLEKRYSLMLTRTNAKRREMLNLFDHLKGLDRDIAIETWIKFQSSELVANKLNISQRTVQRRKQAIVRIVDNLIP